MCPTALRPFAAKLLANPTIRGNSLRPEIQSQGVVQWATCNTGLLPIAMERKDTCRLQSIFQTNSCFTGGIHADTCKAFPNTEIVKIGIARDASLLSSGSYLHDLGVDKCCAKPQ